MRFRIINLQLTLAGSYMHHFDTYDIMLVGVKIMTERAERVFLFSFWSGCHPAKIQGLGPAWVPNLFTVSMGIVQYEPCEKKGWNLEIMGEDEVPGAPGSDKDGRWRQTTSHIPLTWAHQNCCTSWKGLQQ